MGWSNSGWRSDQGGWYKNAAAVAATTTWDSGQVGSGFALSGGNLIGTYTGGGGVANVRSVASHSTGKYYFEAAWTSNVTNSGIGICNASFPTSGVFGGGSSDTAAWLGNGNFYVNNSSSFAANFVVGDVLGFAVDLGAKLVWLRINAGSWLPSGDPAAGTGGFDISTQGGGINAGPYFAIGNANINPSVVTANFGSSAYSAAAPSGYSNW